MVFNDTTTSQGLVQDIYYGINANSVSFPIADVTRAVNNGLDKVSAIILQADNRWQWEDINNTTLPIATTDIVSGQKDYTFDSSFLIVEKVLISDKTGNFYPARNINIQDQGVNSYLEAKSTNTGLPYRYDIMGNSILLDPVPNYSYTGGIKVHFKRKAGYFTTSDTTKEPGFNSQFHKYLSLYAQYEYAHAKNLNQKKQELLNDMALMERAISKHYATRSKDYKPRLIPRVSRANI